ncbi:CBS-domain-containing protein [Rhizophagus clarus]|uniref:CBS-domain-containing protein n=1 Tax=Rhizophagus clarus TaxID=94130 RepID=A0A8H3QCZ9_9GLOM|nr:CBS-domain-containing protein [Rhizophagus clarus]
MKDEKVEHELNKKNRTKSTSFGKSQRQVQGAKGTVASLNPSRALTVRESALVVEASQLMPAKRADCILVIDSDEHLSGIFTAKDLAFRVVGDGLDARTTTVATIMTRNPTCVKNDTSVTDALNTMVARGFRHLPVCDEEKSYDALEGVEREWSTNQPTQILQYMEMLHEKMVCSDLSSVLDGSMPAEVGVKTSVRDAARSMREYRTTSRVILHVQEIEKRSLRSYDYEDDDENDDDDDDFVVRRRRRDNHAPDYNLSYCSNNVIKYNCKILAECGNSFAQYNLGLYYQEIEKDKIKAFEWSGKRLEKAYYWFQKSAGNGNKLAQNNLISYYSNEYKIDEKLVEQENDKIQYKLGYFYENGLYYQNEWGNEKDEIEAFKWFEKSAKQDNNDAQNYLGFLYKNGIIIQEDLEKSFYWYQKSAKDGNKIAQYNLELAGQHNKLFVKHQELLENNTNDNPFSHIQFNEPNFDTNDSEFITVKTNIFPGIPETSYIEVKKLQKLLISRKNDIDQILELQPVYTIGIDFQKNSIRPCIACWVAKSLDITVLECLETIFEDQFEVIYKIVTPLSTYENNNQNLNSSNCFANNEENLEENSNEGKHGNGNSYGSDNNSNGSSNNNDNNGNNGGNNNNNSDSNNGNNINNHNNGSSNNNNDDDDDGGGGGDNSNKQVKEIYIFSDANAKVNDSSTQDFTISAKFWAEINPFENIKTLKYNIDVYVYGIGELLSKNCSFPWLSLGYILESIIVQVSPLPEHGGKFNNLKGVSLPKPLNKDVEHSVGDEMSLNISNPISFGYKWNNSTKYSKHKWEFKYNPNNKGECWTYERNNKLGIDEEPYAPRVHFDYSWPA